MKRKSGFVAVCISLMMNVLPVQADLIWEPMGDSFYSEYAAECEYENRTYIAKTDSVVVYESPVSEEQVDIWEKGKIAYISFVYKDENGKIWGIYDNGDATQSGWVQMDSMVLKYDSQAFQEEFAQQIVEEEVTVGGGMEMNVGFWAYPGAKIKNDVKIGEDALTLYKTFTDEVGHKWAYVGYFRGMKNYWICIDAPSAEFEELYPDGAPVRGVVLEGTDEVVVESFIQTDVQESVEDAEQRQNSMEENDSAGQTESGQEKEQSASVSFVVAIVAGVVAVTGALLALLKKSFGIKK